MSCHARTGVIAHVCRQADSVWHEGDSECARGDSYLCRPFHFLHYLFQADFYHSFFFFFTFPVMPAVINILHGTWQPLTVPFHGTDTACTPQQSVVSPWACHWSVIFPSCLLTEFAIASSRSPVRTFATSWSPEHVPLMQSSLNIDHGCYFAPCKGSGHLIQGATFVPLT